MDQLEKEVKEELTWFGHSSFLLKDSNTGKSFAFIDPFTLKKPLKEKVDVVFITHGHYDHFSPKDLKMVIDENTVMYLPSGCNFEGSNKVNLVQPGMNFTVHGMKVTTIAAYNLKPERTSFHPLENKWVGYLFHINGKKIYHSGDCDYIPEMDLLAKENLDVAMIPMGGTYTMDVDEAIKAANVLKAKITIPIHYRRLLKDAYQDAEQKLIKGVRGKVIILEEVA